LTVAYAFDVCLYATEDVPVTTDAVLAGDVHVAMVEVGEKNDEPPSVSEVPENEFDKNEYIDKMLSLGDHELETIAANAANSLQSGPVESGSASPTLPSEPGEDRDLLQHKLVPTAARKEILVPTPRQFTSTIGDTRHEKTAGSSGDQVTLFFACCHFTAVCEMNGV